jgi:hypothetical protein
MITLHSDVRTAGSKARGCDRGRYGPGVDEQLDDLHCQIALWFFPLRTQPECSRPPQSRHCSVPMRPRLPGAHPLDARPRKELVAGRVPARVPRVEEQAALVLVADVALEVDSCPGRYRDRTPSTQETLDSRRIFLHALLALSTFQSGSFLSRIRHTQGYSTARALSGACQHFSLSAFVRGCWYGSRWVDAGADRP